MAMAVLCCWPYLVGDDASIFPEAMKIPKGFTAALNTESSTRHMRNPFGDSAVDPTPEATPDPAINVETADISVTPTRTTTVVENSDFLTGLTLQATCISGRNRSAMINGDFYQVGDDLTVAVSLERPVQVAWIDENAVVLRAEDRSLVLSYSNQSPEQQAKQEQAAQAATAAADQQDAFFGLDDPASLAELFFRSIRMSEQLRAERDTPSRTTPSGRRTR
jgi:hypothetical protein